MCPLLAPVFKGKASSSFLLLPLTVLMKQTRQAVRAIKQPILLRCLWNKYIATIVIKLMTSKAAAEQELLFNKPALGLTFTKAALKLLTIVFLNECGDNREI